MYPHIDLSIPLSLTECIVSLGWVLNSSKHFHEQKKHRCSSSHDSLRGIHPVTRPLQSRFLLRSLLTYSNSLETFPNNIYIWVYLLMLKQCKSSRSNNINRVNSVSSDGSNVNNLNSVCSVNSVSKRCEQWKQSTNSVNGVTSAQVVYTIDYSALLTPSLMVFFFFHPMASTSKSTS